MNIINNPQEIIRFFDEVAKAGRAGGYFRNSKLFPDFVVWNTTGDERQCDFPSIYFPNKVFHSTLYGSRSLYWDTVKMKELLHHCDRRTKCR